MVESQSLKPTLLVPALLIGWIQFAQWPTYAKDNPKVCSEKKAIAIAQSDPAIANFCGQKVNGVSHGCSFKAREEKNNTELAWVVNASIIHSFDEKGNPRFMPEGAALINISKKCTVLAKLGPLGRPLK